MQLNMGNKINSNQFMAPLAPVKDNQVLKEKIETLRIKLESNLTLSQKLEIYVSQGSGVKPLLGSSNFLFLLSIR